MDVKNFISRAQISLEYTPADANPDLHQTQIPDEWKHYKCTLRGRTHEMDFHFTCPHGEGPPEIENTIRYLGAVASEYESCDDITDWANEYGFDSGHIDTRDAFETIARITRDIWRVVGDSLYEELRDGVEIEQAVDMAWEEFDRTGS